MTIVSEDIYGKSNLFIGEFFAGADPVAATQLAFESGYDSTGVLAGLGFNNNVGVAGLAVDTCGEAAILHAFD